MTSGHYINISTVILGFINTASTSHSSVTHPYSSWYKVSTNTILVGVSDVTGDNEFLKSTPGTCIYPLIKFLYFRRINPQGSSLLLNIYLTGTGFIPFSPMIILLVGIHAFPDRKLFTSEFADICHKFPFGLVIASLRVSGSLYSIEIDALHDHWISSFLCYTRIGMNLVSPVTLYSPLMNILCIIGIFGL